MITRIATGRYQITCTTCNTTTILQRAEDRSIAVTAHRNNWRHTPNGWLCPHHSPKRHANPPRRSPYNPWLQDDNRYHCPQCAATFTQTKAFARHLEHIHRLLLVQDALITPQHGHTSSQNSTLSTIPRHHTEYRWDGIREDYIPVESFRCFEFR